jgi:perosamine synthetase
MILTDSEVIAENCRSLRNLCFLPEKRFIHKKLGWNLRMTNLQAALGLAQFERLEEFIVRKRKMGKYYHSRLSQLLGLQLPLPETPYSQNVYWVYGLVLSKGTSLKAVDAMRWLSKKGIGCRPFFYPMHLQPVLRDLGLFSGESYPVAEHLAENGFYIPSGLALQEEQMERVSRQLLEFASENLS